MSIIEQIKNGARFRHKKYGQPIDYYVLKNGILVVLWNDSVQSAYTYSEEFAPKWIELIPEEETLWVVIPKNASGHPRTEEDAHKIGTSIFGPGNYTIHSITRTK